MFRRRVVGALVVVVVVWPAAPGGPRRWRLASKTTVTSGVGGGGHSPELFEVFVAKEDFKFSSSHFVAFDGFRERLHGHNYSCSVRLKGEVRKARRERMNEGPRPRLSPRPLPSAVCRDGRQPCLLGPCLRICVYIFIYIVLVFCVQCFFVSGRANGCAAVLQLYVEL